MTDLKELNAIISGYKEEMHQIVEQIYDIVWNMRGMTREEAFALSPLERQIILKQIDRRVKMVEKTGLGIL